MKLISVSILVAILGSSFGALAQAPAGGGAGKTPECQAPFAACEQAGFKVGAHKKGDKEGTDNGLWVDCIDAVADGKKVVAGVDQTAAKACRAAKKAMKQSK